MHMDEIQKKTNDELKGYITEQREELRTLRFKISGSGTRDVRAIRNTRRDIARAMTELNRRTREVNKETQ